MRLSERQSDFAHALLKPDAAVPVGLAGPDGMPAEKRFAVYRNNVVIGLIDALRANFPATRRIVGEEFFREMARRYVAIEPPSSPILLDYGAGFPDFIDCFEAAEPLRYLSDVARVERAWTEAYHAPEAVALDRDALAEIPYDRTPELRLDLHPSLRVVRSRFPVLTIWRMNVADGVAAPVDLDAGGEDVLILRPAADVEVRSIPPGGAELILRLAHGRTLTQAARAALTASETFDLSANLAGLIGAGAFVGFKLDEPADLDARAAAI